MPLGSTHVPEAVPAGNNAVPAGNKAAPAGNKAAPAGNKAADQVLSEQLGDELVRLLKVMERTAAHVTARRGDGVDKAAFSVLHRLVHDGPQRSSALAEAMLADPSTISRHVAQLVGLGYVQRQADQDDGRATVLAATPSGTECAHVSRRRRNDAMATVVADWSVHDRSTLTTLLARFTNDLEHHRPQLLAAREQDLGTEGEQ